MYFDVAPKTSREDLFGMEYHIDTLVSHITDDSVRMIVIKGLRRTGKTSLLNVALNETKQQHIKIDVREAPYHDKKEFMAYMVEKLRSCIEEGLFEKILRYVTKIKIAYKEVSAAVYIKTEKDFFTFIGMLDKQLKKKHSSIVIAFDEAQLLGKISFDYVFAAIYDNYRNIKMIITGSEIGLIDEMIGEKGAKAPLFGRALIEVKMQRLNDEHTSQFLKSGFNQIKKEISLDEIKDVVGQFDGIIGWATHYGWLRSKGSPHTEAIQKVMEYGSKLTKSELDSFLANRKKTNYLKVLKYIGRGNNVWALLKNQFLKEGKKVSDSQLNLYLNGLMDYSFIEKVDKTYLITDPLLVKAL